MHLRTRVSVGSLIVIVAASAGWLARRDRSVSAPAPKCELVSAHEEHGPPATMPVEEPPAEPFATIEAVDFSAVPPSYLEDVTPEQAEKLAALVEAWLQHDGRMPVSYRRGLVYVESAEDRGDEGPYPRSAEPEAIHACGSQALWLRSYVQKQVGFLDHVSCSKNVCSYGGMEYAPNGDLIFHLAADGDWELRGWVLTYQAALGDAERRENRKSVRDGLMRVRDARCSGEPDGRYL